jgi:aminopeptidase C
MHIQKYIHSNCISTHTHSRSDPVNDGGQFSMIQAIVAKHGLCPKDVYPESKTSCGGWSVECISFSV